MKVIRLTKEITTVATTRGRVYIGDAASVLTASKYEAEDRGVSCNVYNIAASALTHKYEVGGLNEEATPASYANINGLFSDRRYAGQFLSNPNDIDISSYDALRSVDEPAFGGFFAKTLYAFGPDFPEENVCNLDLVGNPGGVQTTAYVYMTPEETDLAEGNVLFQDSEGVAEVSYANGGWYWIAEPAGVFTSGTRFYIPHKAGIGAPGLIMNGTLTTC